MSISTPLVLTPMAAPCFASNYDGRHLCSASGM